MTNVNIGKLIAVEAGAEAGLVTCWSLTGTSPYAQVRAAVQAAGLDPAPAAACASWAARSSASIWASSCIVGETVTAWIEEVRS